MSIMDIDERFIDRVVQGVLRQLSGSPADALRDASAGESSSSPATDVVTFDERVVTGELLERRVDGARHVVLAPGAILTPTARDVLRTRNLELVRRTPSANASPTAADTRLALVVRSTPALGTALDDARSSTGVSWQRDMLGCPWDAAARAIGAICRGEAAVVAVFAAEAEVVACRANRNARVRAAVVSDVRRLEKLARRLGPNVYCIDPDGRSFVEIRNLLRAIAAATPECPRGWKE